MDVDRFIVTHQAGWDRLADLARRTRRTAEPLTGPEVDELVRGYQRAALHLSQARTVYRDDALVRRLSVLVGAVHAAVHGTRVPRFATVRRFFAWTFPAAAWTCRRQVLAAAALFFGTAIVLGLVFWLAPDRLDLILPDHVQETYVERDFAAYYSERPSIVFFSDVTTNNLLVAVLAYALGALLVVPGALVLFQNGAMVGTVAGLFADRGQFVDTFLAYVLPHGLLELTAVVVAGGAGLRVGWAVFSPGDRSRTAALGDEGRRSITVLLGAGVAFLVAGLVEGFVTGSSALPVAVKVGVGALVWLAFLAWAFVRGRQAVALGFSGALEELRPTWSPVEALVAPPPPPEPRGYALDPF